MSNLFSSSQKQKKESTFSVDRSLQSQQEKISEWKNNPANLEDYRIASRDKMQLINKEFMDGIKKEYGVTNAVPVSKNGPKQSVPAGRTGWLSRRSENKALEKARKKYGNQISVNSIREQKDMEEYENLRARQKEDYDDLELSYAGLKDIKVKTSVMHADSLKLKVKIDGYDKMISKQQLNHRPDHYIRSDEIELGLKPFFAMQKTSWIFWKKTVGALGNETAEEKKSAKNYNKRLLKQYTKSKVGSPERNALLDELRNKIQSFNITADMLTDGYLADHSAQLRRYADMTRAFRVLIDTNPKYLESLSEEDRIMLGNTLNYTGPLISDFLDKHQKCKHLAKKGKRTVFSSNADIDMTETNDSLMKDTWNKIHQADVAEQTEIGIKNKKIVSSLKKQEDEARERRKDENLPDYAVILQYDTTGKDEKRLLDIQEKMRARTAVYDLIGNDMEKLFGQLAKTFITLDTIQARAYAMRTAQRETSEALKKNSTNRRYSAFLQYVENELKQLDHDKIMLEIQADQYETALKYVTDIQITDDDMILPAIDEKDAGTIKNILKTEDLSFLLHLDDCRFYARKFTELTKGTYEFRTAIRETIERARGQETAIHTERIAMLEKQYGNHRLDLNAILSLKPEELEKYNFDGYTDKEGVRHKGAHDLTDEINFRHMKEIESIANMDIDKEREALEKKCEARGLTRAETEKQVLDLETKHKLFKDYYFKWEGTFKGIKTDSWKYLSKVPDMEGQNGIFKDPKVFSEYKQNLQDELDKLRSSDPGSADIARLEDMITFMDSMMIRNGLMFSGEEDIKLMNAEAYHSVSKQLAYTKRQNKALRSFLKNPSYEERNRLINRVDDVLYFEDKYAELVKSHGKLLSDNHMKKELNEKLKDVTDEEEKLNITCKYYAGQAVKMMQYKEKLTPEFFTKEYIRNNFDDFASTALTLRDFVMLIDSQGAFDLMMKGLSEEKRDDVASAIDAIISIGDQMKLLLVSVFSANSINFETGQISYRPDLLKLQMELMPDEPIAKEYRDASETVRNREAQKKTEKAKAEKAGKHYSPTLQQLREDTENLNKVFKIEDKAKEFRSDTGEDYLDHCLTIQLKKLQDMDSFLGKDMKQSFFASSTPTEELYRFLYNDKASKDLSDTSDKEAWTKVLTNASERTRRFFFSSGLSQEARDVASDMLKHPEQINDYLQWKVRQDSRVYMNERSKMLGIKESQADTDIAYEIMDSIEETHSSVHNSANLKMRQTLFPELEKKKIDPEQFMHLLRIVHRTTSGTAGRMVDITNQSANMDRTEQYLDPSTREDFIKQVTSDVMNFEIKENMLTEEYLKEPGNFRYMYFMTQKLKAYEQLYKNDRESVEAALKDNEELLEKVTARFGTFYGTLSHQLYRLVLNFAAKYGVDENGARTFGLSPEEYEQLTEEGNRKKFAAKSKENMELADRDFKENSENIRKGHSRRINSFASADSIRKYNGKWLRERPAQTDIAYKAVFQEKQQQINSQIIKGMEKAIEDKTEDDTEQASMKTVIKLDKRLQVTDAAYFLPENHYKKIRSDSSVSEWNSEVLSLKGLFSGNSVQQMNYLLYNGNLEKIVDVFKKNSKITNTSKEDLYSENYLDNNFSEELYTDALKMAVFSLLPDIISGLFDKSFIDNAGVDEETVKSNMDYIALNTSIEAKQLQATALKSNAEELYKQGKYTQEEYEDSQEVIVRLEREAAYEELERNSLIPSLKTVEQKKKVRSLLNELKSCIGTQAQREFYKNYAYNLKNYVRICGANIDSADNSLGSYISQMDEKKLGVLIGSIKFDFVTSQDAVRRSMNHKPNLSPTM